MWEREFQFLLHVSSLKGPCVSQTISRWLPFDETNASQVYSSNGKSLLYTINSKKTNKWKHHRKCFINVVAWFCLWSTDNLGQNDWNSKPQFPPACKSKTKPCKSQNAPFSHPWFFGGEGEGDINFSFWFILSKIPQGPEEMCLSLEHQNPSKTSEKMGYLWSLYSFVRHSIDPKPRDGTSFLGRPSGEMPCASADMACGYWFSKVDLGQIRSEEIVYSLQ